MPNFECCQNCVPLFSSSKDGFIRFQPNLISAFDQTVFIAAKMWHVRDPNDPIYRHMLVVNERINVGHSQSSLTDGCSTVF